MCAERLTREQCQVHQVVAVLVSRQHGVRPVPSANDLRGTVATVSASRSHERDASTSLWLLRTVVPDE